MTEEIVEVSSRIHAQLEQKGQTIGINDVYLASTALHFKLKLKWFMDEPLKFIRTEVNRRR